MGTLAIAYGEGDFSSESLLHILTNDGRWSGAPRCRCKKVTMSKGVNRPSGSISGSIEVLPLHLALGKWGGGRFWSITMLSNGP